MSSRKKIGMALTTGDKKIHFDSFKWINM